MPIDWSKADAVLDEEEARNARHASMRAPAVDPDGMGRALRIGRERDLPPIVVAENIGEFDERERLDRVESLAKQNPAVGQWLSKPENAALAADDHDGISFFDRTFTSLFSVVPVQRHRDPVAAKPTMSAIAPDTDRAWGDYLSDLGLAARTAARSGVVSLIESPINAVNWINQAVNDDAARIAGLFGQAPSSNIPMLRVGAVENLRANTDRINAEDVDRNQSFRQSALEANRPDELLPSLAYYARNPALVSTDLAASGGYMAAGGIVPGKAQATLFSMAASQASGAVDDARKRLVEKGATDEDARGQAARVFGPALAIGIVAPKLVPGGQSFERLVGGELSTAATRLGRIGLPLVGEPVSEAIEEGGIALATNVVSGDPTLQGVGGAAASGLVAGAGMAAPAAVAGGMEAITPERLQQELTSLTPAQIERGNKALKPLLDASADSDRLRDLGAAVDGLKTKARDRAATEELVQQMADRSPDLPSNVYLNAEQLVEYFQTQGEDAALRVSELMDDPEALTNALAGSGDLVVPISRFITASNRDGLIELARTSPERMSNAELSRVSMDDLAAEYLAAEVPRGTSVEQESPRSQVAGVLTAEIAATGRYSQADSARHAEVLSAAYERRAGRLADGRSAFDLFAGDNLKITSDAPGEVGARIAPVDVALDPYIDDVLANGLEAVETAGGKGIVQSMIDAGGIDPDSVGAGDIKAMGGLERPGLFRKGGLTIEAMGEALAEGDSPWTDLFTTKDEFGRPEINEFLALVTDDLQGAGKKVGGQSADFTAQRNEVAAAVRAIASRGVDVAATGRPTLRRMVEEELGAEPEGTFYQDALPTPATLEAALARIAELEVELRTDSLTGMRNYRAFTEDESLGWAEVASIDLDGLKRVNDKFGHDKGDEMLRQAAGVMLAADSDGVRFYRKGGDEFTARVRDPGAAQAIVQEVMDRLESVDVEFMWEGEHYVYKGIGAGYGIAENFTEADERLNANKQDRAASGLRQTGDPDGAPRRLRRISDRTAGGESDRRGAEPLAGEAAQDGLTDGTELAQRANASIRFDAEGTLIRLGETANLSSLHHESGHLFLDWLMTDAFAAGGDPTLAQDMDTFLAWRGKTVRVADGAAAVQASITRDDHEAFAEGYETYLFEGKAPTLALADLFSRFRSWMLAVYGAMRARKMPISDEMRQVYDRLYASDAEAEAASDGSGYVPLPDNVSGLVGDVRWQGYQKKLQRARDDLSARLGASVLQPIYRERTEEWKRDLSEMESVVLAEAMESPVHRARAILAGGKLPDGTESDMQPALDGAALKAEFGDRFVVDRLKGLYRNKDGQPPALVADLLGFRNAAEMIEALANTPPIKVWVKQEADRRLRAASSDPATDGTLPQEAQKLAHGSPRLAALEEELAMVAELGGQPAPPARALGALARRMVAGMPLRSLRPNDYLVAERKAANEAQRALSLAEPKIAVALLAKRRQVMNAHLYRAALQRKTDAEKAYRYLSRFNKTKKRAQLGKVRGPYLDQIDAIMEQLDLRPASGPEIARRQSLLEFVAAAAKRGEAISIPPWLIARAEQVNARDLTGEQLQGIVDTIRQIDHLARTKGKLLLAGEQRRLTEVDIANAASVGGGDAPTSGDLTDAENVNAAVNSGLGAYLNASSLARDLDGETEGGAVWQSVVAPIQQAQAETELALQEKDKRLAEIYDRHYTRAELRGLRVAHIKALDGSLWSRERVLALAGNRGNPGNVEALLGQQRVQMTPELVNDLLAKMDARDWAAVQDLAGEFERMWPLVAEREKAKTGLVPERVEFEPFDVVTSDGHKLTLPGWYWPLVPETHEARGEPRSAEREVAQAFDDLKVGATARAQTRNGSAIERTKFGGQVVKLDLGVVHSKLRESIRDIHLGPAVNAVYQVLEGRRLGRAAGLARKAGHVKALKLWLVDVAAGEMGPRSLGEQVIRKIRTNASMALMGFKVSTALIQPTGFAQSLPVIGEKWLGVGLKRVAELGTGVFDYVDAASPQMRLRAQGHVEQVQGVNRSLAGKGLDLQKHAWWMMSRTQRIVDLTTFLGAEAKGMSLFDNDIDKARAYAYDAVERAQGSNDFVGKNALQRGTAGDHVRQSEWVKASTFMLGYMMAKGQIVYVRTANTEFKDPSQVIRWTADMVHLFVWEVMALTLLRGGWPDDEDEDGMWTDDFAMWLGKETAMSALGMVPGLAYIPSEVRGYGAKTTGIDAAKTFGNLFKRLNDDDPGVEKADVKALSSALGVAFGFPSSQTNVALDALYRAHEGEDVPIADYFRRPPEE